MNKPCIILGLDFELRILVMAGCLVAAARYLATPARSGSLKRHLLAIILLSLCCDNSTSLPWYGAQVTVFVKDKRQQDVPSLNLAPAPSVLSERQNLDPETSLIMTGSSSVFTSVVSSSLPSASASVKAVPSSDSKLSAPTTAGIAIGAILGCALLLLLGWVLLPKIYRRWRSLYPDARPRSEDRTHQQGRHEPQGNNTDMSEPKGAIVNPSGLNLGQYIDRLDALWILELSIWVRFLSIYGRQGILLRELIMLVSALYSPVAEVCRYPHWSHNGERDFANPRTSAQLFLTLLKEASRPRELQALEERLVHLGLVIVKDAGVSELSICQDWVIDNRSWCAELDHRYNRIKSEGICLGLLELYSQIPDRDVHLMAERYREMFYYHAHVAVKYIFRMISCKEVNLGSQEEKFYDLALQVFSHRYQRSDEKVIKYVKRHVSLHGLYLGPYSKWPERHVMLQLVEFRAAMARHSSQPESPRLQSSIQETVLFFTQASQNRQRIGHKAWSMVGYALTDVMDVTEIARDRKSFDQAMRLTRAWCEEALLSKTPMEMAALCCVLVRLRDFDKLDEMPRENHLSCGCYLSRAGFLRPAALFLLSSIRHWEQEMPKAPIWRYHLELMTVKMRLGQWKEAEHWLSVTWARLLVRRNHVSAGEFDFWKQSGELGEFRLNLASLLSECYIARGLFVGARQMIVLALEKISLMRDVLVTSTRLTLKSRLLNLHLQLQDWHNAAQTAIDLSRELQERDVFPLESQKIWWMFQEILACVDELMHQELYVNAYQVLHSLTRPKSDGLEFSVEALDASYFLTGNLRAEIDQKWNEVKRILDHKDILIQDQMPPLLGPLHQMENSSEIEFQALDVAPYTPGMAQGAKDYGYIFPDAITTAEITMALGEKSQRPESTTQTRYESEKPQVDVVRRRQLMRAKKALNLLRYRKNMNMLRKLPEPPKTAIPLSTLVVQPLIGTMEPTSV